MAGSTGSAPRAGALRITTKEKTARISGLRGTYTPSPTAGRHGTVYYCRRKGLYLFCDGNQWIISARLGSAAHRACRSGELVSASSDAFDEWNVLKRGKWISTQICCRPWMEGDGPDPPAEAVTVIAQRWDSIAGLYILREEGVYENEEDGTFMWELDGRWHISKERTPSSSTAAAALAASTPSTSAAASPEDADWSGVGLAVRGIDYFGVGKTDREAFAPPGVTLYEDTDFLADESGLGTKQQRRQHGWDKAMWRRAIALLPPDEEPPLDLFEGLRTVRGDGVVAARGGAHSAVLAGAIGETWLLAAIGALTEFPRFLAESLFVGGSAVSATGQYTLRLYDAEDAGWKEVTIDDRIACRDTEWYENPRTLISGSMSAELYVLLIEKGLAKLAGSYASLVNGTAARAWLALTGCDQIVIYSKVANTGKWRESPISTAPKLLLRRSYSSLERVYSDLSLKGDKFFETLLAHDASNHILVATIDADAEARREDGLVTATSYPLVRVFEDEASGVELLQLRNPWGAGTEWNGAWSDASESWRDQPAVAKALGHTGPRDDGLFWMSFDDFAAVFSSVEVCKCQMPTGPIGAGGDTKPAAAPKKPIAKAGQKGAADKVEEAEEKKDGTAGSATSQSDLKARLAAARQRAVEYRARTKEANDQLEAEVCEQADLTQRVKASAQRLAAQLEASAAAGARGMENDPDVADATDRLLMMQQRLRAAKDVHKKHAERLSALRQRRELYENANAAPMAFRPSTAPGGGAGMLTGTAAPTTIAGGLGKVLSKEQEKKSVAWLYEESRRRKAAREAAAEEARAKELAAASKRKPLGKAEQQEFVRRVQGYAAKRQANQADALKKLEEEANKTANSHVRRSINPAHVMQRLAPKSLAAGGAAPSSKKGGAGGGAGFPSIPTTAAGHGGAGGAPATPRTSAMQKVEAGKMLSQSEMAVLHAAEGRDGSIPPPALSAQRPQMPAPAPPTLRPEDVAQYEQFELTVPEGYAGGEDLPVRLPDGREVVVTVPDGLGPGDEFVAAV